VTNAPVPNFLEPFILEIDVLGFGIADVLSQNPHPIAFIFKEMISSYAEVVSIY